ncbi:MAG: hypothetical protein AAFQ94_26730 [Bacteroidota bacterium]
MLPYLFIPLALLTLFIIYKYMIFLRSHVSSAKKSLAKFFRFWLKPSRSDTRWEHFTDGKGTFQLSDQFNNNDDIYGGGTSGSW